MKQKKYLLTAAALMLILSPSFSQINLNDQLPVDPAIKVGKLSNGLTYYIRKNAKPEQRVELRLVVKAGAILEDDDQQGLAHFTEHMAFNGSKHFKKNDLISFLQSIGVEFGADLNAYTGFDETVYILPIPVDKPENLEKGFLVLEDWASTVAFEPSEIEKERGVVLEEERLGKGARERMLQKTLPHILEGSKYALRLPIGKSEILKSFKPETIKRFYNDWYRPDLMAVLVVGDVDPALAESMIKKHFEKLKVPAKTRTRAYAEVPSRQLSDGQVVTDPEATNNILYIYYATQKAKIEKTVGDYRQSIIKNLSGLMLSQRMQELTQKAEPPFVFGGSSRQDFVHGYESYYAVALIGKAGITPAISALIEENERARQFGFTDAEIERAKKSLMRNIEQAYNEKDKTESADYVEEYGRNFLSQEPIPGISNEYDYYKQFLSGITRQEINEFTAGNIPSSDVKKLVVFEGPEKSDLTIPSNAELLAMVTAAEKLPVKPYEEKIVASSLMLKAPAGGKIVAEKQVEKLGLTEFALANGVKVVVKPTDFKNDQILLSGFRFGGQSLSTEQDMYAARYSASIISQMGVGEFSPTDLQKILAGKTVSASPRLTNLSEGISGQSGTADVESMLQLVYLYFTSPRKDEELYKSFVTKQTAVLENMMSNPQAVFQDSVQRMLYNFHPRGPRFPRIKDFDHVSLDKVLSIYKEHFGNARGWTFYIVGSFDLQSLKPLIASYLGSLPSLDSPGPGFKDLGIRPVKGVVKREIKKGQEPKSYIYMAFTGDAPYNESEQLKVMAMVELMNIKLLETLREDLSGIYGGGMSGGLNKIPYNSYSINVSLPCGPENVEKLVAATFNEIQKVKDKGPSEEDLNKVKETFIKQYQEDVKENSYWLNRLQRSDEYGSDPASILTVEARVKALTTKDIQSAAKKYLNKDNYFQAVLYPEK